MGFFSRVAAIIKSNLNDLVNRAEDPEKMLSQMLLDMQTQLVEAKKQVAGWPLRPWAQTTGPLVPQAIGRRTPPG